jgi:hypothetical protein
MAVTEDNHKRMIFDQVSIVKNMQDSLLIALKNKNINAKQAQEINVAIASAVETLLALQEVRTYDA